jgi:hypothetical protein
LATNTCENPEYKYVIVSFKSGALWRKVSQITPSVSCWIPNRSGIIARGRSLFVFVCLSAATPIAESEAPAMKLAEAEKHMRRPPSSLLRRRQIVSADDATTITSLVDNRQTGGAMFVQLPAHFFDGLIRAATRRGRAHDLFDAHFRSVTIVRRDAATNVALRDDALQFE